MSYNVLQPKFPKQIVLLDCVPLPSFSNIFLVSCMEGQHTLSRSLVEEKCLVSGAKHIMNRKVGSGYLKSLVNAICALCAAKPLLREDLPFKMF